MPKGGILFHFDEYVFYRKKAMSILKGGKTDDEKYYVEENDSYYCSNCINSKYSNHSLDLWKIVKELKL